MFHKAATKILVFVMKATFELFQGNYTITGNIIMLNAITATGLPGHTIHGTLNADRTEIRMTGYVPFEHDSVIEIFVVKLVQN